MQSPLDLFGLTVAGMQWISHLVDLAFRSSLILLAAAIIAFILRRASAAARHRVWTIAFILILLVPLSQTVIPGFSLPLIPSVQFYYPAIANGGELSITRGSGQWQDELGSMAAVSWPAVAFMLWLGGAVYLFVKMAIGIGAVQLLSLGDSKARFSHHKLDLFADICSELNFKRPVQLLRRRKVRIPMTAGALRPMIILPEEAEEWSDARFRSVLLHELAHVKRWDFLTKQIAALAKIICWFNPLLWIAARHMQTEMEIACDDLVLQRGIKASDYALDLADIIRRLSGNMGYIAEGGAAMAGSCNSLPKRLRRILDPETDHTSPPGKATVALTAVLLFFAMPAFVLQPFITPRPCSGNYKLFNFPNLRDARAKKQTAENISNAHAESGAVQDTRLSSSNSRPVANIPEEDNLNSEACSNEAGSRGN